ncbi:hypothetical protein THRCLA_03590 [Thraustotheca clavata]|uniref:peptidylprolyl isomerase n=1 Tax=Thraustotheca clavata TaxID=74557 RepID=A0A1W0A1K3_9STRA|nr:hypothetical protein THRCLA_03590 [Thraustotheca clavata]
MTYSQEEEALIAQKPLIKADSVAQKIEQATLLKNQGNVYFKHEEYKKAINKYKCVSLWITGLSVPGDSMSQYSQGNTSMSASASEGEEIQQLLVTSHTNIAMARIKLEQYDLAIEACDKALSLNPTNVKALVRKAQAYSSRGKYSTAKDILRKALEIEPKNGTVRKALQQVIEQNKLHPEEDQLRQNFANMFNKSGGIYK